MISSPALLGRAIAQRAVEGRAVVTGVNPVTSVLSLTLFAQAVRPSSSLREASDRCAIAARRSVTQALQLSVPLPGAVRLIVAALALTE
jgi:hypothetical protein